MRHREAQPLDAGSTRKRSWTGFAVLTAIYVALTLFSTIQNHVWDLGTPHASTWPQSLAKGLQWPTPWYLLTPLLLAADDWIQARSASLPIRLGLHAGGMALAFIPFALLSFMVNTGVLILLKGWGQARLHGFHPGTSLLGLFMEVPFMYGTVILASTALRLAKARREGDLKATRLSGQLAEARLALLQRQLHPHFLFNALQAVSTLLHRDPALADATLLRLSGLLRMMLDEVGTGETSLRAELEMTKRYLEIEEIRFQDRLTVVWDVDGSVLDSSVPSLLLLPLVENAIRHGLSPKIGPGRLQVSARREGQFLRISVDDDGTGASFPLQIGVGLGNTLERLRVLYKEAAEMETKALAGGGFHVGICLPLVEENR